MNILEYLKSKIVAVSEQVIAQKIYANMNGAQLDGNDLFEWCEVVSIEAYKRDLVAEDLICLDIVLKSGERVIVHEELIGFGNFKMMMHSALSIQDANWLEVITEEPFETSRTNIYKSNLFVE